MEPRFADLTRPVTASFAGAPAIGFTTFGAQAPRDGVVLGLGANTRVAEQTRIYLRYDGDLAGGNTNHVLNVGDPLRLAALGARARFSSEGNRRPQCVDPDEQFRLRRHLAKAIAQ